jgi:hypothetical protein
MPKTATEDLWLNADRSKVVSGDSEEAAFLLARAGSPVSDADAERYGVKTDDTPVYDAVADHAEKHGGETDAQAAQRRDAMLSPTGGDDDGPAAEGERGKAAAPQANKARAASDNK